MISLNCLLRTGSGFSMALKSSSTRQRIWPEKGLEEVGKIPCPSFLRILLMDSSCDVETAPEASQVYFTDR
jgi:hypothetical protein